MFSQLKAVVDLIKSCIIEYPKLKSAKERETIVLDLLRAYFLFKDCVDDGEKLVEEAGNDPVAKIKSMDATETIIVLTRWDKILRKQGIRLYELLGCIFGQDHLAVVNPELQNKISKIIGYKMDRTVTLHGIGAALYFRNLFPVQETIEEKAELVSLMAGAETDGILDMDKIAAEVAALRASLDEYRAVVQRLVTNEELLSLSTKARQAALIEFR